MMAMTTQTSVAARTTPGRRTARARRGAAVTSGVFRVGPSIMADLYLLGATRCGRCQTHGRMDTQRRQATRVIASILGRPQVDRNERSRSVGSHGPALLEQRLHTVGLTVLVHVARTDTTQNLIRRQLVLDDLFVG